VPTEAIVGAGIGFSAGGGYLAEHQRGSVPAPEDAKASDQSVTDAQNLAARVFAAPVVASTEEPLAPPLIESGEISDWATSTNNELEHTGPKPESQALATEPRSSTSLEDDTDNEASRQGTTAAAVSLGGHDGAVEPKDEEKQRAAVSLAANDGTMDKSKQSTSAALVPASQSRAETEETKPAATSSNEDTSKQSTTAVESPSTAPKQFQDDTSKTHHVEAPLGERIAVPASAAEIGAAAAKEDPKSNQAKQKAAQHEPISESRKQDKHDKHNSTPAKEEKDEKEKKRLSGWIKEKFSRSGSKSAKNEDEETKDKKLTKAAPSEKAATEQTNKDASLPPAELDGAAHRSSSAVTEPSGEVAPASASDSSPVAVNPAFSNNKSSSITTTKDSTHHHSHGTGLLAAATAGLHMEHSSKGKAAVDTTSHPTPPPTTRTQTTTNDPDIVTGLSPSSTTAIDHETSLSNDRGRPTTALSPAATKNSDRSDGAEEFEEARDTFDGDKLPVPSFGRGRSAGESPIRDSRFKEELSE
jgi:hypothetical protein